MLANTLRIVAPVGLGFVLVQALGPALALGIVAGIALASCATH